MNDATMTVWFYQWIWSLNSITVTCNWIYESENSLKTSFTLSFKFYKWNEIHTCFLLLFDISCVLKLIKRFFLEMWLVTLFKYCLFKLNSFIYLPYRVRNKQSRSWLEHVLHMRVDLVAIQRLQWRSTSRQRLTEKE